MSRHTILQRAARTALDDSAHAPSPGAAVDSVRATLEDPALREALGAAATLGRLSNAEIQAMRDRRRRTLTVGSTLALLLVAGGGAWQTLGRNAAALPTRYETQRGEERVVALADGSRLELNGATSLDVTFDAHQRSVVLHRGEAYFDVAHETTRPFVVTAQGSSTRVLGTAFDIDLVDRDVRLAVFRGRVRFGGHGADTGVTVPAGWHSRFHGGIAGTPSRFDPTQQDWRQNWLDTDEMRLGDLVATLNRRSGPTIQAPSAALAGLMLSGRFKLDDPEHLLGAIGAAYGFGVVRTGGEVRLTPTLASDAKRSSE